MVAVVRDLVAAAVASGISRIRRRPLPLSRRSPHDVPSSTPRPDDAELHQWSLHRLGAANDPSTDLCFQLLALINGWSAPERLAPVIDWSVTALRMRAAR